MILEVSLTLRTSIHSWFWAIRSYRALSLFVWILLPLNDYILEFAGVQSAWGPTANIWSLLGPPSLSVLTPQPTICNLWGKQSCNWPVGQRSHPHKLNHFSRINAFMFSCLLIDRLPTYSPRRLHPSEQDNSETEFEESHSSWHLSKHFCSSCNLGLSSTVIQWMLKVSYLLLSTLRSANTNRSNSMSDL